VDRLKHFPSRLGTKSLDPALENETISAHSFIELLHDSRPSVFKQPVGSGIATNVKDPSILQGKSQQLFFTNPKVIHKTFSNK
jgi:hypothetical protein